MSRLIFPKTCRSYDTHTSVDFSSRSQKRTSCCVVGCLPGMHPLSMALINRAWNMTTVRLSHVSMSRFHRLLSSERVFRLYGLQVPRKSSGLFAPGACCCPISISQGLLISSRTSSQTVRAPPEWPDHLCAKNALIFARDVLSDVMNVALIEHGRPRRQSST